MRTHCGGNIVPCDVVRPWQNAATLLRVAQEMFLKCLCPPQMLRAGENESTFGENDHLSNVAATMVPRFTGP